jgi:hypothetical protein
MRLRFVAFAFAAIAGLACKSRSSAPRDDPPAKTTTTYACSRDGDCPALACGPCTPGVVITKDLVYGRQCTVNPCSTSRGVCGTRHLCVVGPKTENDPATWGPAPYAGPSPNR